MRDALERAYRFVLPGSIFLLFLLPLWWLIGAGSVDWKAFSALGTVLVGYSALYQLVQKSLLERAIDKAWKKPVRGSWEDELNNWSATSWLFPGARLGYRLRRMRYLAQESYKSEIELITLGQARGYVDVSSYIKNAELKHKVRLAYVYSELSIILGGFFAAAIYVGLAIYVGIIACTPLKFLVEFDLVWEVEPNVLFGKLIVLAALWAFLAWYFLKIAGAEIERVESVQHGFSVEAGDYDWQIFSRILETLKTDLEIKLK